MKEKIGFYTNEPPLVTGNQTYETITDTISRISERKVSYLFWVAFAISGSLVILLLIAISHLVWEGIGIWGLMIPVAWGWDITNFVFWVGIGHAGTLISAILHLLRQRWRTSINRFSEAMTLFAIICAGMFPAIHVGRIWVIYWVFPVPNQMMVWPNFRSPLLWDVFAVGTYFTVSFLFWYNGLIPDLATLRDRAASKWRKKIFGFFAVGWRGANRQWKHYELAYLILAGVSTPLVLSVHSVVSTDFAVSTLPGWHSTIFPPYFVAGAIFSGFAMVMTLGIIARRAFHLENFITVNHFDKMAKITLVTSLMVTYAYVIEAFIAWYSGNVYERFTFFDRAFGQYAWAFWIMIFCNCIVPQLFWFKRFRTHMSVLFVASLLINVGMWFERFVIIVQSLARDFMPGNWNYFKPTIWDIFTFAGSIGLFIFLFLLFARFLPMIAMSEVKGGLPLSDPYHYNARERGEDLEEEPESPGGSHVK